MKNTYFWVGGLLLGWRSVGWPAKMSGWWPAIGLWDLMVWAHLLGWGKKTSATTNSSHLKISHPKRKRSYSNHPFSGAMLVSGRVAYEFITAQKFILKKNLWDSDCGVQWTICPTLLGLRSEFHESHLVASVGSLSLASLAQGNFREQSGKSQGQWMAFLGRQRLHFLSTTNNKLYTAKPRQRPKTSCVFGFNQKTPRFFGTKNTVPQSVPTKTMRGDLKVWFIFAWAHAISIRGHSLWQIQFAGVAYSIAGIGLKCFNNTFAGLWLVLLQLLFFQNTGWGWTWLL